MLPPPKPAPQVQLLPAAGPIYIEYGTPTHVSLAPCLTGNASSSCGAVAWDVAPSRRTDLTPYLAVASAPSCSSDSSGPQVCLSCGLKSLAQAGPVTCLPGTYTLTYSATNDDGVTATATRAVTIYSAGQLSMQLPLYQNLDNETAAGLTVQALSNASSAEAAAAANSIASQLSSGSSAGLDVQPHDISILQAQLVELGPSNFSIHVSAVISIYYPASVHRGDIIDSKVQTAAGSGSRRALLSTPSSFPATAGAALLWAATSEASSTALETHQGGPPQVAVDANIQAMLSSLRQLAAAVTAEARSVQHSALSRTSTTACSNSNTEGCSASRHTSKGRRLLQATDTGIAAQLTSMTSAASSSLAPVSLTGQQTSAAVDPVVGYLSSLASTVDSLQQGVADMAAASSSMSDRLGQAFGEADQRKQDAATTKVSDAYKGLLADWQSLSQQVGSLSDQAARRFDEQLQASQDMAALVAATMATISDATTAAQRLQEKYVQQTLLMQAGGDEAVWVCNRTSKLAAQFSIRRLLVNGSTPADASSASNSSSASQRRSLLASKAGRASSVSRSSDKAAAAQLATWEGYWLPTHSRLDADDLALPGAELPRRFIGAAPGKKQAGRWTAAAHHAQAVQG